MTAKRLCRGGRWLAAGAWLLVLYGAFSWAGQGYVAEVEPNGTAATASPLPGIQWVARASLFPKGDVDFYSFTANAGDRVYAAVMTSFSAGSSTDSQITLLAADGATVIEFDDDNGSFAALSSSIAGATIPSDGTYFLKINDFTAGTTSERPYELHFRLQSGAPTPEVEGNDTPAAANPLPANGWVSGTRDPASASEQDWYSLSLNAGDTVFLSLDLDPERDSTTWNGRLGFGLFGDAGNQILAIDDAGTGDVTPNPNRPSEAMFFTVKTAGTYYAVVDSASDAVGGPTATYHLSVSVHPATDEGVNCTTYSSTDVPKTIGPGTGLVSSTITVPGNPRIGDIDVEILLDHALMQDIDAHLRSPAGNDNGLFTDIGAAATGGQTQMELVFDDEAGIPPAFAMLKGVQLKPENNSTAGTASTSGAYRLSWFDGEDAGGTWTLDLRDDTAGANGGTLTGWSLRICEAPPPPACPPGFVSQTVFSTDFESGAGGFTHSGTQDEWELGLPATAATTTANPVAAFTTCNSGVNCWKTDLDNTYNASSNQDLFSPSIDLAGLSAPVVVTWAQRHQIETANFDHMFVDFQQVGGATPVRLYEWQEPTPISASAGTGNPQTNIGGSAGWGVFSRRADSLVGLSTELRFHLDSDTTVQFAGLAIDDVSVTACAPVAASADLSITKTDSPDPVVAGSNLSYTITVNNSGPVTAEGVSMSDALPTGLTFVSLASAAGWSCTTPAVGGVGTVSCSNASMPVGQAQFILTAQVDSGTPDGTSVSNTATASSTTPDPVSTNNAATATTTVTTEADLSITKTDSQDPVGSGNQLTYTIDITNSGPSDAQNVVVTDTLPAGVTFVSSSGCAEDPNGVPTCSLGNIAAGAMAAYTVTVAVDPASSGTITNTATVTSDATDPNAGNDSVNEDTTVVRTSVTGPSPTGSGDITASFSGGGPTCTFNNPQFISVDAAGATPPSPPGVVFPHGLFDFSATGCTSGSTIEVTVTYPADLPPGAQYWKYGPTPKITTPHWYVLPATISGNQAVFSITDGGLGDDDLTVNGTFVEPGGAGAWAVGGPSARGVPTLSQWGLILLSGLLGLWALVGLRHRPG